MFQEEGKMGAKMHQNRPGLGDSENFGIARA